MSITRANCARQSAWRYSNHIHLQRRNSMAIENIAQYDRETVT